MITSTKQIPPSSAVLTNYIYSNGELVATTSPGSSVAYTYFEDKPQVAGDYISLLQILNYGAYYYKPAHLLKTFGTNGSTIIFSYEFDEDGKMTSCTFQSGSALGTFFHEYDCH